MAKEKVIRMPYVLRRGIILILFSLARICHADLDPISLAIAQNVICADTILARMQVVTSEGEPIAAWATVNGLVSMADSTSKVFNNPIVMRGVQFIDGVDFSGCNFQSKVEFSNCHFYQQACFYDCIFGDSISFMGAHFYGLTYFQGSTFNGKVDFFGTTFQPYVEFSGATFRKEVDFQMARFDSVDRPNAQNLSAALFRQVKFLGGVSFERASFMAIADWDCTFVDGRFNLKKAVFVTPLSLTDIKFSTKSKIILDDLTVPELGIAWEGMDSRITTEDPIPSRGIRRIYSMISKQLSNSGNWVDADNFYIEGRNSQRALKHFFRQIPDYLSEMFWGYGVRPLKIWAWAGLLILVSGVFFSQRKAFWKRPKSGIENYRFGVLFALGAFFNVNYHPAKPLGKYRVLAQLLGIIGWIFSTVFVISLSRVLIR